MNIVQNDHLNDDLGVQHEHQEAAGVFLKGKLSPKMISPRNGGSVSPKSFVIPQKGVISSPKGVIFEPNSVTGVISTVRACED